MRPLAFGQSHINELIGIVSILDPQIRLRRLGGENVFTLHRMKYTRRRFYGSAEQVLVAP
jgi:hypothetical protein